MEAAMKSVRAPDKNIRITKWKVKPGHKVTLGAILCMYDTDEAKGLKIKSSDVGTVHEIMGQVGDRKPPGSVLVTIEPCKHPTVMKDMCAECGADLREEAGLAGERREPVTATVAMVHSIPELIVSEEQAKEIGKEDENRLLKTKKLVLLVDLDQTLIHTTNDSIPANLKGVFHYQLRHGNGVMWYHTRIRPGTEHFLETISKMFELHICTFGARMYAHVIARHLDPNEKYFSHRILSRDECFNPNSKTANLKALFPCGDKMVCIIDDREDVWNFAPNLIHVKPYRFFQGTADINAPPGLTKTEHDMEPVHHRVRRVSRSQSVEKEIGKDKDDNKKSGDEDTKESKLQKNDKNDFTKDKTQESESSTEKECPNEMISKDKTQESESNTEKENPHEMISKDKTQESERNTEKDCPDEIITKDRDTVNNNKNGVQNIIDSENSVSVDHSELKISEDINQVENSRKQDDERSSEGQIAMETDTTDEKEAIQNPSSSEEVRSKESDESCKDDKKTKEENADESSKDDKKTGEENADESSKDDKKTGEENADNLQDEDVEIEWDDDDDYLLYLEEILTRIHKTFFDFIDQMKSKNENDEIPNLKDIISYIKRKVLQGVNIVFSGVFPTNIPPEKSRAYIVAKALGANIQTNIVSKADAEKGQHTTHLVAAKQGTNKVKLAQKVKGLKIVNPNWLWSCAERYELVDERCFPLEIELKSGTTDSPDITEERSRKRKSDPTENESSMSEKRLKTSNEQVSSVEIQTERSDQISSNNKDKQSEDNDEESDKNAIFSSTYNPLLAFSDDDLAFMDKEVEDIMDEDADDNSSEDDDERDSRLRSSILSSENNSSSEDSLSADLPRGWKKKDKSGSSESPGSSNHGDANDSENDLEKFENTVDAFAPDSDSDNDSIGSMDDEMAAAIEKEFLEL